MSDILAQFQGHSLRRYDTGQPILTAGEKSGLMLVLAEGAVEVRKDGVLVDLVKEPGAVLGEIAALLDGMHTADVTAAQPCALYVIEQPREFLRDHPEFHLHVSALLAKRLGNLVKYLADVKLQYEGHDHISMVDQVLDTLLHRQPRKRGP
jgi:CRP/FNR family transcriptional regulator, cyclic AMP receptor protein